MKKPKVGIAGFGVYFGGTWADAFSRYDGSELTTVCDLDVDKAGQLAGHLGAETVVGDFDEMLGLDLDIIGVFTPGPLHSKHVISALEAGKHVVCAVPTAMSMDECQDLLDAVERTGMKYMLAETAAYDPYVERVKEMNESGEMGDVFFVQRTTFQDLGGPKIGTDYFSAEKTPDGIEPGRKYAWRYGLPPFYYIEHSTGPIITALGQKMTEVTARGWGCNPDNYEEKYGAPWSEPYGNPHSLESGTFLMDNGAVANISIGWIAATGVGGQADTQFWGTRKSYLLSEGGGHTILTGTEVEDLGSPEPKRKLHPSLEEMGTCENP
jgi:predicted dehydrogenase